MKNAILLSAGVAAVGAAANGYGNFGGFSDLNCITTCLTDFDFSNPTNAISSVCPTATDAPDTVPTLISCLSSACPSLVPTSAWPSISADLSSACSAYSACSTDSATHTYTLSFDPNNIFGSGSGAGGKGTTTVVTATGCLGLDGWGGLLPTGFTGLPSGFPTGLPGNPGGPNVPGNGNPGQDWCDQQGKKFSGRDFPDDLAWSYSYSCISTTATLTDSSGNPTTTFSGAIATTIGALVDGTLTTLSGTAVPTGSITTSNPPGAGATVAPGGAVVGAVLGVGMLAVGLL